MNLVNLLFVSSTSIVAGSASFIHDLASSFENDIPGSVDWLVQWALEEALLDRYIAVVHGNTTLAPNAPLITAIHASYLLHYENPELPVDELEKILAVGIAQNRIMTTQSDAGKISRTLESMSTLPDSLFRIMFPAYTKYGSNVQMIAVETRKTLAVSPNRNYGAHAVVLRDETQLMRFIRAWLTYCFESLNSVPTCYKDGHMWRLLPDTRRGLFRHIALKLIYQRADITA